MAGYKREVKGTCLAVQVHISKVLCCSRGWMECGEKKQTNRRNKEKFVYFYNLMFFNMPKYSRYN